MKRSIITNDMDTCYICGCPRDDIHHIFFGTANRKISDKHGLVIPLCRQHHTGNRGVHFDKVLDQKIKQMAQRKFESLGHSREEFRKLFGKSYL